MLIERAVLLEAVRTPDCPRWIRDILYHDEAFGVTRLRRPAENRHRFYLHESYDQSPWFACAYQCEDKLDIDIFCIATSRGGTWHSARMYGNRDVYRLLYEQLMMIGSDSEWKETATAYYRTNIPGLDVIGLFCRPTALWLASVCLNNMASLDEVQKLQVLKGDEK